MTVVSLSRSTSRVQIPAQEVAALRKSGALVVDLRRERPRYFDGRFLAARDLIRDQQYMLTREADLARTAGSGVGDGLQVSQGDTPQSLRVAAGEGLTPLGELVLLPQRLDIHLADIPMAESLSARFGLSRLPAAPAKSRTGLFVLALRPVEFTDNPIGAYPTSLTGSRTVEDGDVIEATAVVLVPWQDDGAAEQFDLRRARTARTIFTQAERPSTSANVLPIAMLALQSNNLVWIDEAMVRRELGADRGDLPGLGFAPHGLRLAHLMQYQNHLADLVHDLKGRSFPAASQFQALPPAGPLPPGVIDTRDFSQRFFPAVVDVDFSIIPEDELPALVEESLALPPIDLLAPEAALDLTAVLILAPVARADFRAVRARLETRSRQLKPTAANLVASRRPLELLRGLRLPQAVATPAVATPADAEWARLASQAGLWYVRRRNLAYRDDLVGNPASVAGTNELAVESRVRARLEPLGLLPTLDRLLGVATPRAAASIINLMASPRLAASPALTAATLGALVQQAVAQLPAPSPAPTPAGGAPATPAPAPSPAPTAATPAAPAATPATTTPATTTPATTTPATTTPAAPATASTPAPTGASTGAGTSLPTTPAKDPTPVTTPPIVVKPLPIDLLVSVPPAPAPGPDPTVVAVKPGALLDQSAVLAVAADVANPTVGAGLVLLEKNSGASAVAPAALSALASGTDWTAIDQTAQAAPATQVAQLTSQLNTGSLAASTTVKPAAALTATPTLVVKPTLAGATLTGGVTRTLL